MLPKPKFEDSADDWEIWLNEKLVNDQLGDIVDELGRIKAEIAPWLELESLCKEALRKSGEERVKGSLFECVIIRAVRATLKKENVIKKLGEAWVKRNSKKSTVVTVKVTARTERAAKTIQEAA